MSLPAVAAARYARANRERFVRSLCELVAIPSVSVDPARAADVRRCGELLARQLRQIGLQRIEVVPTARHPVVYGEWLGGRDRPTVLVYGHYDVQPADPPNAWRSPPFQPVVRGAHLYGRGAADDKGQLSTHLRALESYLATGRPPVNVKCLFEGEEEIGSPNLPDFLKRHRSRLRANVAVMSDTRMLGPDQPALAYSLRGSMSMELVVRGPRSDLHSGNFGGAVHNPVQALAELLAGLHDRNGRVTVRGFYDAVQTVPRPERVRMARSGPSDADILRDAEVARGWGELGFSVYERTTIRPALTMNGIAGGYQGPGGKAIIPAEASAKLNVRLVPDQRPEQVARLLRAHVARTLPTTVTSRMRILSGAMPVVLDRGHPAMRAAAHAYRRGFGKAPVFVRSGGTIPVVNLFRELLGIETVLMGFALPSDRIHAPNERFGLSRFTRGIATAIAFLDEVVAAEGVRRPRYAIHRRAVALR